MWVRRSEGGFVIKTDPIDQGAGFLGRCLSRGRSVGRAGKWPMSWDLSTDLLVASSWFLSDNSQLDYHFYSISNRILVLDPNTINARHWLPVAHHKIT